MKYIISLVGILTVIWVIEIMIGADGDNLLTSIVLFVSIYVIAFFALRQTEIYPFEEADKNKIIELFEQADAENQSKNDLEYAVFDKKKLISDEKFEAMKAQLLAYMEKERPYLDSELSLVKLSQFLGTSTHILSYVINTGFSESFYQFVNKYRIEEAQKLLIDPKMSHLSLLGIGFEVGFNSKSVFNAVFKK
ncbi:MAG: helix-turn-helix transcriptional regulator [Saprospiraceae bacterium]|nr:helix-turn-helix transcriptional regulator [Saprospiraceae bacterium]